MTWREREVAVHESGRTKTMHIVVERDGSLAVQVPRGLPERKILEVLERRAYSIFSLLTKWREAHAAASPAGASDWTVLYGGKRYRVEVADSQKDPVAVRRGSLLVSRGVKDPRAALKDFFRRQAKARIARRLTHFAPAQLPLPKKLQVREMATRWGSCTPNGTITYNWRCVQVPPRVLDYLIVHELVHLECHSHSRDFWSRVAEIVPNYERSIAWLRKNGIRTEL
ncbi:MAG: M48 family metallopeptidase [Kiritimatiellae bacterium]|nr:M48 family metallopeptidase [Kiritimatiellia bacterium]